jgi:hypothetical protein
MRSSESNLRSRRRPILPLAAGLSLGVLLVFGTLGAPRAFTSLQPTSLQPPWPASYPFGLGAWGTDGPGQEWGIGSGGSNSTCQYLFVEFNATGPAEINVIPTYSATYNYSEYAPLPTSYWSSPVATGGRDAILTIPETGFQIWAIDPSSEGNVTIYVSDEELPCA